MMIHPDSRIMVDLREDLNRRIRGTTPSVFSRKIGIKGISKIGQEAELGVRMEEGLLVYTMGKCTVVFVIGFQEHVSIVVVNDILSRTARHRLRNLGTRTILLGRMSRRVPDGYFLSLQRMLLTLQAPLQEHSLLVIVML